MKKIISRNALDLDEIPPEVWKTKNLISDFFDFAMPYINKVQ